MNALLWQKLASIFKWHCHHRRRRALTDLLYPELDHMDVYDMWCQIVVFDSYINPPLMKNPLLRFTDGDHLRNLRYYSVTVAKPIKIESYKYLHSLPTEFLRVYMLV